MPFFFLKTLQNIFSHKKATHPREVALDSARGDGLSHTLSLSIPTMLTPRSTTRTALTGIIAAALFTLVSPRTEAASFSWVTSTGFWTNGPSWGGAAPKGLPEPQVFPILSGISDVLTFSGDVGPATLYTTTNNSPVVPFTLNQIICNATDSTLPATTNAHTVDGGTLRFTSSLATGLGTAPQILVNNAGALTIENKIILATTQGFTLGGPGVGVMTLNGGISGYADITKSGTSTYRFGTPGTLLASDNTWLGKLTINGGTIRFNNNAQSGPTALRANPVVMGAGALLTVRRNDADQLAGYYNSLRMGTLSGAGGAVTATVESTAGGTVDNYDIAITALTDGNYSGTLTLPAPLGGGDDGGALVIRGTKIQTLSGVISINKDVVVGQGATLKLAASATLGGQLVGSVIFAGGTLILDNSANNGGITGRLRDAAYDLTTVDAIGGGTLSIIGNTALGTSEVTGRLMLGAFFPTIGETKPRSGQLDIRLTHTATTKPTELTFQSYSRDESTASELNTVDFSAVNGAGAPIPLGNTGSVARIFLTKDVNFFTVPLAGNLLSATAGTASTGWATVGGTDFATYDVVTGIKATTTVPYTTALQGTDNALLTGTATTPVISYQINSLKIAPSTINSSLNITGSSDFSASGILLAGARDYSITSTGGGGIGGSAPRFIAVQNAGITLTLSARVDTTAQPLVKFGAGILDLTNINNFNLDSTTAINAGTLRASIGTSLPDGEIQLRGGILELTGGGTLSRTLGIGHNAINWSGIRFNGTTNESQDEDRGSGGIAAKGTDVTLDLAPAGPSDIRWEDLGFVRSGYTLVFGSATATNRVTFSDNLNLTEATAKAINYNARQIRVLDNTTVTTDIATLSGVLSGESYNDLLKTGPGTLELSNPANTYTGGTIIHEGTLLVTGNTTTTAYNDVQSGATLAGTGTTGPILVETGGTISPGAIIPGPVVVGTSISSVGTLTTTKLTLRPNSILSYNLTPTTTSDKIVVNGIFEKAYTGGSSSFNFGGTGEGGRSYPLITFTATSTPAFTIADFGAINLPVGLSGAFTITGPVAGVRTLNYTFAFPVPTFAAPGFQPIASQRVTLGQPATIAVKTNSTLFGYQWKFGTTTIVGNGATTPTLTIPAVADTDAGSYTCTVSRVTPAASVTSNASVLIINHRSIPASKSLTVIESTPENITLTGTDPDAGDTALLTYIIVDQPAHGTLTGTGANRIYTPTTNYNGLDSFTFKTNDGLADSAAAATISIEVKAVNSAPTPADDTATLKNISDVTATPITVAVLDNDTDPDIGDIFTVTSTTDGAHGAVTHTGSTVTYTPGITYTTSDTFTYTITDGDGASGTANVTILLGNPAAFGIARKGTTVPGGDIGDTFTLFGQPSISLDGTLAFTATYKNASKQTHRALFTGDPTSLTRPVSLFLHDTDLAPGTSLTHTKFSDPAMNANGDIAYKATLKAAPTGTAEGIWARTSVSPTVRTTVRTTGAIQRLVVQGKMPVPSVTGATIAKILDFALPGDGRVVFTATLAGVPPTANSGIFRETGTGSFAKVLRTGDTLGTKTIKTLTIFGPVPLTTGQQRGFNNNGQLLARVTFTDKTSSLVRIDEDNSATVLLTTGTPIVSLDGATIKSFNLPVLTDDGNISVTATLLTAKSGPATANSTVLLYQSGSTLTLVARTGTPISTHIGTTPAKLGDLLSGDDGKTFFYGILKNVPATTTTTAVTATNNLILWRTDDMGTLSVLARKGDPTPDIQGGYYKTFTSLAYTGSGLRGPAFIATVAPSKPAAITAKNDTGLWVLDNAGKLRLALREGVTTVAYGAPSTRLIKSFNVLTAALGNPSQGRSYNPAGAFTALVTYSDNTTGIITIWVP